MNAKERAALAYIAAEWAYGPSADTESTDKAGRLRRTFPKIETEFRIAAEVHAQDRIAYLVSLALMRLCGPDDKHLVDELSTAGDDILELVENYCIISEITAVSMVDGGMAIQDIVDSHTFRTLMAEVKDDAIYKALELLKDGD